MNKSELYKELDFVRSQILLFKERAAQIDGGNWRKTSAMISISVRFGRIIKK